MGIWKRRLAELTVVSLVAVPVGVGSVSTATASAPQTSSTQAVAEAAVEPVHAAATVPTQEGGDKAIARRGVAGEGAARAAASQWPPPDGQPASRPNPRVPDECGLKITLVLDASGSIGGNSNNVRNAGTAFLNALADTGSEARVLDFATMARETAPMTPVTSATLLKGGIHERALTKYYEFSGGGSGDSGPWRPYQGGDRGDPTVDRSYGGQQMNRNQYTNWQEALEQSQGDGTQLVVFITDGDPTAVTSNGKSNGPMNEPFAGSGVHLIESTGGKAPFEAYALYKGINAANALKTSTGSPRILAVGVGAALDNPSSLRRLQDIAGPTSGESRAEVWRGPASGPFEINQYGVTAVREFSQLAAALRGVATGLCSPSLTITKLAQSAGSKEHVPVPGWGITVAPKVVNGTYTWTKPDRGSTDPSKTVATDANGQSLFQWKPDGNKQSLAAVTEEARTDFTFDRADCRRLDDGVASNADGFVNGERTFRDKNFQVPLASNSIATCTLYNDFDYKPDLTAVKKALDNPVRGDGPGWDELYAVELTNPGNTPLLILFSDPKCRPGTISGPGGDTDGDNALDPGESWAYTCKSLIQTAITAKDLKQPNTAVVTGVPPTGTPIQRTVTNTVDVKTPQMEMVKTAFLKSDPNKTPIGAEQVPAGTEVTYIYTLRNTGNDNIKDVQTPKDDLCKKMVRTSGTGTTLNRGETWTYECSTRLLPSSDQSQVTNTVVAKGNWSGACPADRQPPCQNNSEITTTATKTINVSRTATINVVKSIDPPPAPDRAFAFTASGRRIEGDAANVTRFSLNPGAATPKPSQTIRFEPIPGDNTAVITETVPNEGFDLTAITCVNQNQNPVGTVTLANGQVSVPDVQVGDNITCTYTNRPLPKLTVLKATSPSGATQRFGFTARRPAPISPQPTPATFTLGDGNSQVFDRIPISGAVGSAGREFTIEESTLPAGWGLNQIACGPKQKFTQNGNAVTVTLDYGDDITCTFTNAELRPATITVAKAGPNKSDAVFPFQISGTGLNNPGQAGTDNFNLKVGGSRDFSVRPSAAGDDYTITEAPLPSVPAGQSGWTRTSIECVNAAEPARPITGNLNNGAVTVAGLRPGQHVTCTYVNERLPRLEISKQVQVATGQSGADQTFGFTQTGLPGPASFGPLGNNGTESFVSLTPGQAFTVTESAVTDWRLTGLQCSGPGASSVSVAQGSRQVSAASGLQPGDDVRCEYVNTKEPSRAATLTVVKQVDPASDAPRFDYTLSGFGVPVLERLFTLDPDTSGTASRAFTFVPADAGSEYSLNEAGLPGGWDFSTVACSINGTGVPNLSGPDVRITLRPGDAASCTYVNKPKARFTVVKRVSVAEGQAGADRTFAFTQTGLSDFGPLGNNGQRAFTDLTNGSAISVTEEQVAGWTTDIVCTGPGSGKYQVTGRTVSPNGGVASGDDVTCVYTNTRTPSANAVLTVEKRVEPKSDAPGFGFTLGGFRVQPTDQSFTLDPDGSGTASRAFTFVPADAGSEYSLNEAGLPGGWDFSDVACQVNGTGVPNLSGPDIRVTLRPGDKALCTYVNKPKARFTVVKRVSVAEGQTGADRTFAFTQTGLTDFGPLGNNGQRAFADLTNGSAISVTEETVAGWSTDIVCSGPGSERYEITGREVRSPNGGVASGDDVTCVYTNTRTPSEKAVLTVVKRVEPKSDAPAFGFTLGGFGVQPTDQSFTLDPDDSGSASRAFTFVPADAGSEYSLNEVGLPGGWDFSDVACRVNGSGVPNLSGPDVRVTLRPGDTGLCTYVNKPKARFTVVKRVSVAEGQAGADRTFAFTQTGLTDFGPLGNDGQRAFTDLANGSAISVTEETVAGWNTDITCTGPGSGKYQPTPGGRTVSPTGGVASGDDVTCVYTNTRTPSANAVLTVEKRVEPKSDAPGFGFTLGGFGVQPSDQSFTLDPDGSGTASRTITFVPADAGSEYSLNEAGLPGGWDFSDVACRVNGTPVPGLSGRGVQVTLRPGDTGLCTYVNKPQARFTVVKRVSVAEGQAGADRTFAFTQTGLTDFGPLGNNGQRAFTDLANGSAISVTEEQVAGWNTDIVCTGPGSGKYQVTGRTVSPNGGVASGDDVTCVYTNTRDPSEKAVLTVVKRVEPKSDAPGFGFTLGGFGVQPSDQSFTLDPDGSGTASRAFTFVPADAGSAYSLNEAGLPTGWDFSDVSCSINSTPVPGLSGRDIQVTLRPGDTGLCTYVNKPKARFTVVKRVSVAEGQAGADRTFSFTQTGLSDFGPLGNNGQRAFTDLANGSDISVTEEQVAGWNTDIVCNGPGSGKYQVTGRTVSPTGGVASGDDVTCVYTNTRTPSEKAVLTVVKQVEPATSVPAFDFALASSPNSDPAGGSFTLQPDANGSASRQFTLSPRDAALGGTAYTIKESPETGWDLTAVDCQVGGQAQSGQPDIANGSVQITMNPGDTATCVYTNKPKAKLTILKTVSVGVGQSGADQRFAFAQTGLTDFGPLGNNGRRVFNDLVAGTAVSVTETPVAGWNSQVTCSGPGSGKYQITQTGGLTVAPTGGVASGDNVTCHYVNTKNPLQPALLTVTKTANPVGTRGFDFTASGTGLTTVDQPGSTTFTLNPPTATTQQLTVRPVESGNTYTVDEDLPAGWVLRSVRCTVVTAAGATSTVDGSTTTGSVDVDLAPGDTGSCVYDNEELGSLTVVKQANPADGTRFDFTATNVAPTSFQLGNGESRAFTGLAAGTKVDLTENVPTGAPNRWSLVGITCTGNSTPVTRSPANSPTVGVTVAAGEDVTCTYSDAKVQPALITVNKTASPPDGADFAFTASGDQGGVLPADQAFTLTPQGAPSVRTFEVYPTVNGESYTITENLTAQQAQDWQLTSITCNQGGAVVSSANPATFNLQPGDAVSCQYVNRRNARLTVLKTAPDDPSIQFPLNWGGPNPLTGGPFDLADGGRRSQFPLLGGTFFVEELTSDASFPKDWYLAGGNPVCTGTSVAPDYTRPSGANLQIGDGEDVSCTFANFYDYRPGIQVVKSSNRDQVLAGGEVTYGYKMTNTGNIALEPDGALEDVLTDDKCAPVTRTVGTGTILAVGDTWEFTCTATGITDDVTNTATGRMIVPPTGVPVTGTDTHTVTVLRPSAALRKVADKEYAYAGDTVTYSYELENTGEAAYRLEGKTRDEWLTDDKCSPVKYGSGDSDDNQLLDIGETWKFTCATQIQGTTTNTVSTPPTPVVPQSPTTGPPQIGPPSNLTTTFTVTVVTPGGKVEKKASAPAGNDFEGALLVPSGSTVRFDYDVTSGDADTPMEVLALVDDKCSPVVYKSGDTNGDGLLDVDETWKYTCEQKFEGDDVVITNVATLTVREPKGGKIITTTSERRVRSYQAKIFVEKTPDVGVIRPGDPVTYTFKVLNTGLTPVSSVEVKDDKCSPVEYQSGDSNNDKLLDVTETWIYTCRMNLDVSTLNRVTVTGTPPGGGTVTTTTTARVQTRTPGIKVVKTGSEEKVLPGTKVTYDYKVTNTGTLALAEVRQRIRDDKCSPVKYLGGDKDGNGLLTNSRTGEYPDETWRFRCTARIDETTKNTVTTVGIPVNNGKRIGKPVRNTDTWTVTVPGKPGQPTHPPTSEPGTPGGGTPSRTGADIARALLIAMMLLAVGSTVYYVSREGRSTRRKG